MAVAALILKNTQIHCIFSQQAGMKKKYGKRMTVLIYGVIKSSVNGVSISSATDPEASQ